MKPKPKTLLADKIADILTTAPVHSESEDDPDPETVAKITDDNYLNDEEIVEEEFSSKLRKQNVDLLADIDERYAGKKVSRRDLKEFSDIPVKHPGFSDSEIEESDKEHDVSAEEDSESNDTNEEAEDGEDDEDDDDDYTDNANDEENSDVEDNFQHISGSDVSSQVKKGTCVRNQIKIWESLLEMRIQLQKCLIAANKMPQKEKYIEAKKEIGKEFTEKVAETKNSLGNLLDKLILLQKTVQKKYPETEKLGKQEKKPTTEEDDEEIPSDTDDENVEDESENEEDDKVPKKKRRLLPEFEKEISENFGVYKPYRNSVVEKWHEKTRLTLTKNQNVTQSIVDHIEHTLSDRSKLLKRTQLRRSEYKIEGEPDVEEQAAEGEEGNNSRITQIYNSEIFDDDDFYHQLLRELIEMKAADMTDPVQLGRQWMQLQNLRSKMKRKIDTRATKGRKIRYAVHTKLVNFMAPIDEHTWTDEAKNELFSSLFGKKQVVNS